MVSASTKEALLRVKQSISIGHSVHSSDEFTLIKVAKNVAKALGQFVSIIIKLFFCEIIIYIMIDGRTLLVQIVCLTQLHISNFLCLVCAGNW